MESWLLCPPSITAFSHAYRAHSCVSLWVFSFPRRHACSDLLLFKMLLLLTTPATLTCTCQVTNGSICTASPILPIMFSQFYIFHTCTMMALNGRAIPSIGARNCSCLQKRTPFIVYSHNANIFCSSTPSELRLTWRRLADLQYTMSWPQSTVLQGLVYVRERVEYSRDIHRYEPRTQLWTKPPLAMQILFVYYD